MELAELQSAQNDDEVISLVALMREEDDKSEADSSPYCRILLHICLAEWFCLQDMKLTNAGGRTLYTMDWPLQLNFLRNLCQDHAHVTPTSAHKDSL